MCKFCSPVRKAKCMGPVISRYSGHCLFLAETRGPEHIAKPDRSLTSLPNPYFHSFSRDLVPPLAASCEAIWEVLGIEDTRCRLV